ncbi:hypothetical protein KRX52_11190 [Pseudomonas sp. MAP12]|uniref:Uncharacterized protein n=1 Tax=Geopseudomonas aromaticivorans TaxID=2849492 RepID=A0ABS6MX28_9GAMM|nr:hypothetical protein [Pseudomonas aromaticivorans]MBV2133358.1 hypothetical protein [Pseudomonas aromaticivorans]
MMTEQEKEPTLLRWEPGMEIASEKEYQEATNHLAKELLRDYTPEQLAVIAAQHVIYVDALSSGNTAAKEAIQIQKKLLQREALKTEIMIKNVAKIAKIVLNAKNKQRAKKGGDAKGALENKLKTKVLSDWEKIRKTNNNVQDFAKNRCEKYCKAQTTIASWVYGYEHEKRQKKQP